MAIVHIKMDNIRFGHSCITFPGHRLCMHLTAWLQLATEMSSFPHSGFLEQGHQLFLKAQGVKYLNLCRLNGLCHHYSALLL